jgi:hypothetical protein
MRAFAVKRICEQLEILPTICQNNFGFGNSDFGFAAALGIAAGKLKRFLKETF